MKMAEIRQRFVEYYKDIGYQLLPSSPMIDPSIPMSFVMSAGLVQVENSLARSIKREGNQYVLVQNCFRHFDLEKVGTDDTHLSLFEMPGAFVFGPDGRAGTVQRMWKLAISILGLEKDKIWVTYFKGGKVMEECLPEDTITRQAWQDVGLPSNHIMGLGADNNYWVQGKGIKDTNTSKKCGPNTEIFLDRGVERACGPDCKPSCKCGRFVELANSLFICSEIRENSQLLHPLVNPFTETVIGTERVAMILQGKSSVFETDHIIPLINFTKKLATARNLPDSLFSISLKKLVDHTRALCFLIADGAPPPGKDGRARIVKLLVRGALTGQLILEIKSSDYWDQLITQILATFDLAHRSDLLEIKEKTLRYLNNECHKFSFTVERGLLKLQKILRQDGQLTGPQIVYLEKQCGLPIDLIVKELYVRGLYFPQKEYAGQLFRWKLSITPPGFRPITKEASYAD